MTNSKYHLYVRVGAFGIQHRQGNRAAHLIAVVAVVVSACSTSNAPVVSLGASTDPGRSVATTAQVLAAVEAAQTLDTLPDSVGFLTKADWPATAGHFDCHPVVDVPANIVDPDRAEFGECAAGAEHGTKLMVVFGDSRARMWGAALEGIAAQNGYKLRTFLMAACSPLDLHYFSYEKHVPDVDCDQFRPRAISAIRKLHPNLIITTGFSTHMLADRTQPTPTQWQKGWETTLKALTQPGTQLAMIGDIPDWETNDAHCLAGHVTTVQQCSVPQADGIPSGNLTAEQAAATTTGTHYIPTLPWVCATKCEPVIANIRVYQDRFHFTNTYTTYLTGALAQALQPTLN
jgi:predicted exporter